MTISSGDVNKYRYQGNGVTAIFAFNSRVYATSDLIVEIVTRSTDALEETLTISTHYSVAISDNGTATVTVTAPAKIPSSLQDIVIRRSIPKSQTLSLPTGTNFPAKSVENMLDKVVSIAQDTQEAIDRAIKLPPQSSLTDLELPTPVAGKALKWNATEDGFENSDNDPDEAVNDATAQAVIATNAASTATTQAGLAQTAYDNFDDRYLGQKAVEPTLDNDGNALLTGAIYFNTVSNKMRVWNGSAWQDVSPTVTTLPDGTYGDIVISGGGTDVQVEPDVITAKTSGGMIIEADNGTDVAQFGAGNTANATFFGNVSMNTTGKIVNMADPSSAQDGATKAYVDNRNGSIDRAYGTYSTNTNLTTVLPYDDTIPQNTEGTEILSVSITPKATDSRIRATFKGYGAANGTVQMCGAMFINSVADAVDAGAPNYNLAGNQACLVLQYEWNPASVSAQTVAVRVGPGAAGNMRMNGTNSARLFGGIQICTLVLEELG